MSAAQVVASLDDMKRAALNVGIYGNVTFAAQDVLQVIAEAEGAPILAALVEARAQARSAATEAEHAAMELDEIINRIEG